jgi:hypothetical protein
MARGKRTVPLPETIIPELKAQMKVIADLHEQDLSEGYDGVCEVVHSGELLQTKISRKRHYNYLKI